MTRGDLRVDFRSDTVTRPTAAMRRAMATAEVGDDVFGDDPTVAALEGEVAGLFGKEAALFFPSGSMANQAAARLHTSHGEEVLVGEASHSLDYEMAGLSAISGLQARVVPTRRGLQDPDVVRRSLRGPSGLRPACRLLVVENTHNFHGGAVVPIEHLRTLSRIAKERGAAVHLDGARLWNASVASGTPLSAYGEIADTLMVSLSKGLGAPVGSLLIGDRARIGRAREVRKLLGGGMRQVGILAAAGLVGVRTGIARLAEDHARAKRLAEGLAKSPGVSFPFGAVDSNIVWIEIGGRNAAKVAEAMKATDVLCIATGESAIRFVTHFDVDDVAVDRALAAFPEALRNG